MTRRHKVKFSAIDLFCGCGGLSIGLKRAGFKVVAAIDNDSLATATYEINHKKPLLLKEDIRSVDAEALMERLMIHKGDLDLMAGCPPCQGFSSLRTLNGSRSIREPKNDLVFEFARFVHVFQPKTIMMENVPALLGDDRLIRITEEFEILGYKCEGKIFDAVEFGVAQRRRRMIFIGLKKNCPSFASSVRGRRSVAAGLEPIKSARSLSKDPAHNYAVQRSKRVDSLIKRIPKDGGSRTDLPEEEQLSCHRGFDGFKDIYGRMAWGKPAPTITGGCINPSKGRFLHPDEDRAITLREAACLQGFPVSYKFDLTRGRYPTAQLIGNAFPPKFAEHHARSLYRHLTTFWSPDH